MLDKGSKAQSSSSSGTIEKLLDPPTYEEFLECHLKQNKPVIIGRRLIEGWPALQEWTQSSTSEADDISMEINWGHLSEAFGDQDVSVSDCSQADSFGNLECESAKLKDVVTKWQKGDGQSLYVKDWHLARSVESAPSSTRRTGTVPFYTTPTIFADDWMNAYYTAHTSDDFRFVYVGAAGTFTPLHRDVYCSYSWSTNVCGRKRWWLFPPEQTPLLFMRTRKVSVHDVRDVDPAQFPDFAQARPLVVEQDEGETIFVPSGWYHQVENLTACVSINHNWCNSVNLPMLYDSMCEKVVEVEDALEDVRDMLRSSHLDDERAWKTEFRAVVQGLVQQDAGWNWLTFWRMVAHALGSAVRQETGIAMSEETGSAPQPLFPCAPVHLRPPLTFIHAQVRPCYQDFLGRDRLECEGDVLAAVQEVGRLLELGERSP
ncbi:cupin-like domain-containing protein [Phanerochaete sordida]|uniref:Cupin-like domain-containing protein n=1 Tax=Phanerochaete sordida TaxID=48140 RepID=A0A9P3GQU2_9APHY|nr:cupin-like domain-containing protein [Phanerochaete sordida]